jgi:dihydropyrimidine dehydrogenase (NAD+) subunit PreA
VTAAERAAPDIDIFNGGSPLVFGTNGKTSFGTYSGGWKHLITCRYIAELSPRTSLPIIGGGGILSAADIVKTLMYGSSLALVCYGIMAQGFSLLKKLIADLEKYLDETGYERLQDVKDMALQYLTEPRNMEYELVAAHVDADRCNGCGICAQIGCCEAIRLEQKKAWIDKPLCVGCGLCRGLCLQKAITMERIA